VAEIFSNNCYRDKCPTPDRLSDAACERLGALGVSQCRGKTATMGWLKDGRPVGPCKLIDMVIGMITSGTSILGQGEDDGVIAVSPTGEIVTAAAALEIYDAPSSMARTVAEAIVEGTTDPFDIPTEINVAQGVAIEHWGDEVRRLENIKFPDSTVVDPPGGFDPEATQPIRVGQPPQGQQ